MIERLDDGLCAWRARHPEWHPGKWGAEVVSFAIGEPGRTLLVDPLVPDNLWEELDGVVDGSVEILITVPYHVRSAGVAAARYGARVWGHPACAKRLADAAAFCELRPDRTPEGVSAYVIGKPRRWRSRSQSRCPMRPVADGPIHSPARTTTVLGRASTSASAATRVRP